MCAGYTIALSTYQKVGLEKSSCIQYLTRSKLSVHAEIERYRHVRGDIDPGFRGSRNLLASTGLV